MSDRPYDTSTRREAMARSWATRKANAAAESLWWERPVCLCGCGEQLVRHRNPDRQRLFKPGHDARLKSVAAAVIAGEVSGDTIPLAAKVLRDRIGFLKRRPELRKAF